MKHWTPMQRIVWLISVGWLLFVLLSRYIVSWYFTQQPEAYLYWIDTSWPRNLLTFTYEDYPLPILISIPLAILVFSIRAETIRDPRSLIGFRRLAVLLLLPYAFIGIWCLSAPGGPILAPVECTLIYEAVLGIGLLRLFWNGNVAS